MVGCLVGGNVVKWKMAGAFQQVAGGGQGVVEVVWVRAPWPACQVSQLSGCSTHHVTSLNPPRDTR